MTYRQSWSLLRRLQDRTKIDGDCWRWTGSHTGSGHGKISVDGKDCDVHRISASIHHGLDLKSSLQALHKQECPNPDCWNPDHLYIGTAKDNVRDSKAMGTFNPKRS